MSAPSEPREADDERPATFVATRQVGPDGRPGELIWTDTGSGPGRTVWVPDPE